MKRLALCSVLLAGMVASGALESVRAQQPQSPVFRSGTSLVAINVTVMHRDEFVTGLGIDDFAVYEDGIKQELRFFESTNVPLDLILLLDGSSSMRDKMETVRQAALGFIETMREGDRGAVVVFNDVVEVVQPLTTDQSAVEAAIQSTRARGGTALHNALYIALKQFGRAARDSDQVRRQAIAILSDGNDTASLLTFDDVLAQARRSGVSVYTIGLKSEYRSGGPQGRQYFSESDYALRMLARETGGLSFFPGHVRELRDVYASIAEELSSQYSLGYAPSNGREDGRFRRIVVRVVSRPGVTTRARSGYLADGYTTSAGVAPQVPR